MFTKEQLKPYIESGLVSERVHPKNENVFIYNYTNKCQYDGAWDEVTTHCRGLIIEWNDRSGSMLSNPFPKFFNYEEHLAKGESIPNDKPVVYKKYDGWLGILYWLDGRPYVATRGSFESEGSEWATKWLREYVDLDTLNKNYTYIFEIISPITRIVCHYPFEGLVFLTAREITEGGSDVIMTPPTLSKTPPNYLGQIGDLLHRAEKIPHTDYETLRKMESKDEEGFVLHYPSGLRLKIKFEEYKRLHKIMTGLSEIGIWEMLRDGKEPTFENIPDEFFKWLTNTIVNLKGRYRDIEEQAQADFTTALRNCGVIHEMEVLEGEQYTTADWHYRINVSTSRKDFAIEAQKSQYPALLFAMIDKRDLAPMIWKMVRPKGGTTFTPDDI